MKSKYFTLIVFLLLSFIQVVSGQNIQFYPPTDTVHAVDGCTGVEFICTLTSANTMDSIIITPGFNTYFEYLDSLGVWLPIDRVYFLSEDTSNTFEYELLYWPLGLNPWFAQIYFDSAYTSWDYYFKIIVIVSSNGTNIDSASQVFKTQIGLGLEAGHVTTVPEKITLYPNYPNPFNNITTIKYYNPHRSKIKLSVYDALGQLAAILINEEQSKGIFSLTWQTEALPSGLYYIQIDNSREITTRKCILLK